MWADVKSNRIRGKNKSQAKPKQLKLIAFVIWNCWACSVCKPSNCLRHKSDTDLTKTPLSSTSLKHQTGSDEQFSCRFLPCALLCPSLDVHPLRLPLCSPSNRCTFPLSHKPTCKERHRVVIFCNKLHKTHWLTTAIIISLSWVL